MIKDGLSLMFYDNSVWAKEMLVNTWTAGGKLYKLFRNVDHFIGVSSWEEAFEWLNTVAPGQKIKQIQFWGHGSPGKVWINGKSLSRFVKNPASAYHEHALELKKRLTEDSTIWFRSCAVFSRQEGHDFAKDMSTFFNCKIAAHTYIVAFFQSGLHSLKPGQTPSWSITEGVNLDGKTLWSRINSPNTIICLQGVVPSDW